MLDVNVSWLSLAPVNLTHINHSLSVHASECGQCFDFCSYEPKNRTHPVIFSLLRPSWTVPQFVWSSPRVQMGSNRGWPFPGDGGQPAPLATWQVYLERPDPPGQTRWVISSDSAGRRPPVFLQPTGPVDCRAQRVTAPRQRSPSGRPRRGQPPTRGPHASISLSLIFSLLGLIRENLNISGSTSKVSMLLLHSDDPPSLGLPLETGGGWFSNLWRHHGSISAPSERKEFPTHRPIKENHRYLTVQSIGQSFCSERVGGVVRGQRSCIYPSLALTSGSRRHRLSLSLSLCFPMSEEVTEGVWEEALPIKEQPWKSYFSTLLVLRSCGDLQAWEKKGRGEELSGEGGDVINYQ